MSSEEARELISEIVPFLSNERAEIRKAAVQLVLNYTSNDQDIHALIKEEDVIRLLCRLVCDLRSIAQDALKSLINITAIEPLAIEAALKYDIVNRLMNQLEESDWELKNLAVMLLANITTLQTGAEKFMNDGRKGEIVDVSAHTYLYNLTQSFFESEPEPAGVDERTNEPTWDDDYQYVANIWANITQLEAGRMLLLRCNNKIIGEMMRQLRSPNVIRRLGSINVMKNLCFSTENHFFLYDQHDICPKILYLLAGPEPLDDDDKEGLCPSVYRLGEDKKREQNAKVRLACIEALLLLCVTRNGRNVLRKKKVYPIIRDAHLVESDEEVSEQIYKLVDFLMRDEEREELSGEEDPSKQSEPVEETHFETDTSTTVTTKSERIIEKEVEHSVPVSSPLEIKTESKVITSTPPSSCQDEKENISEEEPDAEAPTKIEMSNEPVSSSDEIESDFKVNVRRTVFEDEGVSEDMAHALAAEITMLDVHSDDE